MQVEQKRVCGSCGSENAPDAGFCWRCLVPFAQIPPPPASGPTRPGFGMPSPPHRLQPAAALPPADRASSKVVGAIVSIVAAIGGYFGVQYLLGSDLALPESVAGAQRLTDTESRRFEEYTAEEGERYGIDAEGGVYGSSLTPDFFVILVEGSAVETTDQLFDALLLGFSQAGAVVDEAGTSSGTRGESDYRCAGAEAGPESVVACMWRDDGNVGIVMAVPGDLRATRRLLWTVHDTVVG
jgi:hypothetical protein